MQTQVPTKAPARGAGRKYLMFGLMLAAVAVLAFCWGRSGAQQPQPPGKGAAPGGPPAAPSDYSRRVVAHIHGGIPVTREELGEYLIARFGEERVENFVNRRIIEVACQKAGVSVTEAEVDAELKQDLKALNINEKDFKNKVLKAYGKSLYEWKEDVLRPKLMLTRLCRLQVQVTDKDLQAAFEAHHGPKVECKMILIPKNDETRHDFVIYDKVRKSDAEFDSAARKQAFAPLAAQGGVIPPIYKGYPEAQIEKEAFSLQPGEVSRLLTLPDGSRVILKCIRHIPAETGAKIEQEREKLQREVTEARLTQMVPQCFKQLREQANPQIYMKRPTQIVEPIPTAQNPAAPQPGVVAAPGTPAPGGILPVGGQKK